MQPEVRSKMPQEVLDQVYPGVWAAGTPVPAKMQLQ